jgi:hypothetical protein
VDLSCNEYKYKQSRAHWKGENSQVKTNVSTQVKKEPRISTEKQIFVSSKENGNRVLPYCNKHQYKKSEFNKYQYKQRLQ